MSKQLGFNFDELRTNLARTKEFSNKGVNNNLFIKMGKDGRWTLGPDELEISEDSEWAVNPMSFVTGWSAFDNNSNLVGEEMRPMSEPPITQSELPVVNGKWAPQVGMQLKCIEGKDSGQQVVYYARSRGGISAIIELLEQIYERIEQQDEACVPLINLLNDSYKHKKYGKIYTPVLHIADWITMDGPEMKTLPLKEEEEEEAEEQDDEPRPARRTRRR